MKKILIGLLTILASVSVCIETTEAQKAPPANVPTQGEYNVRDFGAKGDGTNDDTHAIQSAIDHVLNHGGGTLLFPNGHYRLATLQEGKGVKAHLIIRETQSEDKRDYVMIRLRGQSSVVSPCSYAVHTVEDPYPVWDNGTVFVSDVRGTLHTDPAIPPTSVIATEAGRNVWGFNQVFVRLEDFAVQVKAPEGGFPLLSGIDMTYAGSLYTDNLLVYASTRNVLLTSPTKAGHYSAGFIGPRLNCNPEENFQNVNVKSAFRYGFIFSEHANGNNLSAWNCDNAFVFAFMHHAAWFGRLHAQNCAHILAPLEIPFASQTVGRSFFRIEQLGVESNKNQKPIDFNYRALIQDPTNQLCGSVEYHIVVSNVGPDNSDFKAVGGENLKATPLFSTSK